MTAKQQITEYLSDGTKRCVNDIAAFLGFPVPATRRNLNQLVARNEVFRDDETSRVWGVNHYYRPVVQ